MNSKRTKHSPVFKAKVALAALREQETIAEIARRYKVHANMVYKWRQILLENLPRAFETEEAGAGQTLLHQRGQPAQGFVQGQQFVGRPGYADGFVEIDEEFVFDQESIMAQAF